MRLAQPLVCEREVDVFPKRESVFHIKSFVSRRLSFTDYFEVKMIHICRLFADNRIICADDMVVPEPRAKEEGIVY